MENIFLKQLASRDIITSQEDINAPFSFVEWKQRRLNYAESDIVYHYNQYVIDWFTRNKSKPVSQKFLLRQKYLYLLSQLQLFFSDEEKNQWYNKVNLADEKELLLAIPYFAKKLKTIALYYLKLRKKLKNTKLRYNLVGTETGLAQEIQNRLLEVFSSLNTELPPEIQNNLPQFEDLQNNFTVQIEQLYDDSVYFDRDPAVALSAYYDPFHQATADFFATKGLTLSSDEWIFNSFNVPVTADLNVFVSQLTGNVFEQSDANSYGSFIQKFLGESKFTTAFASASSTTVLSDVLILTGTNFFYYPYGPSSTTLLSGILPSVALSSINIPGSTSSTVISGSDVIYVKVGDEIKKSWLKYSDYLTSNRMLEADLVDKTTSFIFPFPGYGLSAEDVEWTGPSLSSTPEYQFLVDPYKTVVNDAYWNQSLPSDATITVPINETTLIASGALAGSTPSVADKIYLRERSEDAQSASTIKQAAWLFKPQKTNIPISITTSASAFLWPFHHVSSASNSIPNYVKSSQGFFKEVCHPTDINQLDVPFAVASNEFQYAEKVFKLQKYDDLTIDAIECCWLSGCSLSADDYAWTTQGGFSCYLSAGKTTKFVWTGPDNTPIDQVFTYIDHSPNCPFVTLSADTDNPSSCACKQVYYSPFGHSGATFADNNARADYIAVDTENNLDSFDSGSWRDSLSSTSNTSEEFAWFKTNENNSWGNGSWVATNGQTPFNLKTGKSYFYKRTASRDKTFYPPYIVNFKYAQNNTKWIEARQLATGDWISTDKPSNLKLYPGDIIKWEKQPVNTFYQLSTISYDAFPERRNSAWCTHDYLPLSGSIWPASPDPNPEGPETIIIWPAEQQNLGQDRDLQFPLYGNEPITFPDVEEYYWWRITRTPYADQYTNNYTITALSSDPFTGEHEQARCRTGTVWTSHSGSLANGYFDKLPYQNHITVSWPSTYPERFGAICYPSITAENDPQYPQFFEDPVLIDDITKIHWWKIISPLSAYYVYDPTVTVLTGTNLMTVPVTGLSATYSFYLNLTGTYNFEISAQLNSGLDFYFKQVPTLTAIPPIVYWAPGSTFVTFSPTLTGTYATDVSAKLVNGADYYFNTIPLITAVPNQVVEKVPLQTNHPVTSYAIQQTLVPVPSKDVKPYWAVLNINQQDPTRNETGYQKNYIDGYLPDNFPRISPIEFNFGDIIDYERKGPRFVWKQPLTYSEFEDSEQWMQITQETLSSTDREPDQIVTATTDPTNIVLSNFIDGKPVEITYIAKNSFTWQVSTEFINPLSDIQKNITTDLLFGTVEPWNVLSNRFYPTIATVPTTENLYSEKESGGFFTPTKLGASQYINDNFTPIISGNYYQQSLLSEDTSKHIGGRGLTKTEQDTIYDWEENNQWLKEPSTANQLAGAVKKSLTKSLQTFVPYQNTVDQKQFGLITPTSRTSPWGGPAGDQWTDKLNEPKGFTGVRNVSAWSDKQILKQNQKVMDSWVTDIFGNQYGLFKSIDSDTDIYHRAQIGGQLWTRTNDQIVKPGYVALSAVIEPFKSINTSIYQQLTGEGITNVDCFFDTLMIQTSSIALFSKLRYNYESAAIEALIDNTRFKLLTSTNFVETKVGQNWFFPTEKSVFNVFTTISANQLLPELFELDLVNNTFIKQFPYSPQQQASVISSLSSLSVQSVDVGLLTYSKQTQQFLISIPGKLTNNEQFLVDVILNDREQLDIESIIIYTDTKHPAIPFPKKITITNDYFYDEVPFEVGITSTIVVPTRDTVVVSISAINNPTYFELINFTSNVTAANDGTFSAFFNQTGLYQVNYKVGNDFGYNMGCLTLSAVDREDVILLNGYDGFLKLNGYNGRFVIKQ